MNSDFDASSIRQQAEILERELFSRICGSADVIAWAEGIVAAEPAPHATIIDIAMARRSSFVELIEMLRQVPGSYDEAEVRRVIARDLLNRLDERPEQAARIAEVTDTLVGIEPDEEVVDGLDWLTLCRHYLDELDESVRRRVVDELRKCLVRKSLS